MKVFTLNEYERIIYRFIVALTVRYINALIVMIITRTEKSVEW